MIYMNKTDMIQGNEDIRAFIKAAIPEKGVSSDYRIDTEVE